MSKRRFPPPNLTCTLKLETCLNNVICDTYNMVTAEVLTTMMKSTFPDSNVITHRITPEFHLKMVRHLVSEPSYPRKMGCFNEYRYVVGFIDEPNENFIE